jgi:SAM-dependent methyltransferase
LGPAPSPQAFEWTEEGDGYGNELNAGPEEFDDGPRFFRHFHGRLRPEDLLGKHVLDVGCGYGGRTVYYAEVCGAGSVHGVEIDARKVERCRRFAEERGSSKTKFSVGRAENLPFPDDSFDAVISFDVLEHCQDPRLAVTEITRVLRPGGKTWNVFPTYKGARASHLDYITRLPLLHRVFHPDTISATVNEFLELDEARKLRTNLQEPPSWSSLGHYTLPRLNGMTLKEAQRIFQTTHRLSCDELILTPLIDPQLSRKDMAASLGSSRVLTLAAFALAQTLASWQRYLPLPEFLVQNIAVCATKV